MNWSGERLSADINPGGNQFTITSAASPTPDVEVSDIPTSGIVLKVHKSVDDGVVALGEPDNISLNGSSNTTTAGTASFGSERWRFDATAIWADLTPAEFEIYGRHGTCQSVQQQNVV